MTYAEFATALSASNLPTAYGYFPAASEQSLPCVTYEEAYTRNKGADTSVFKKISHFDINLYTKRKEPATESALEGALSAIGFWNKTSEEHNEDGDFYKSIYEMEILIDG